MVLFFQIKQPENVKLRTVEKEIPSISKILHFRKGILKIGYIFCILTGNLLIILHCLNDWFKLVKGLLDKSIGSKYVKLSPKESQTSTTI